MPLRRAELRGPAVNGRESTAREPFRAERSPIIAA